MDRSDEKMASMRLEEHPNCFVCSTTNGHGLDVAFRVADDGCVEAAFPCDSVFAGYPGTLHGGVICSLLDGAMANRLFAGGVAAVTVDINVRFRHPVVVDRPAVVRAWIKSSTPPLHRLEADLRQDGVVVATARARFMERQAMTWFEPRKR